MNHDRGTQTGLIGEDSALHTPGHREAHTITGDPAADSLHRKGAADDGSKDRRHLADIGDHDGKGADYIGDCHKGNQLFRNRGDALDAADDDQACQNHQDDAGNIRRDTEDLIQVRADRIDLAHVADPEGRQRAEYTE